MARPLGGGSVDVRARTCVIVWVMGVGGAHATLQEMAMPLLWVRKSSRSPVLVVSGSVAYSGVGKEGDKGLCEAGGKGPEGLRIVLMPHVR